VFYVPRSTDCTVYMYKRLRHAFMPVARWYLILLRFALDRFWLFTRVVIYISAVHMYPTDGARRGLPYRLPYRTIKYRTVYGSHESPHDAAETDTPLTTQRRAQRERRESYCTYTREVAWGTIMPTRACS
jgi:hypothetical protein